MQSVSQTLKGIKLEPSFVEEILHDTDEDEVNHESSFASEEIDSRVMSRNDQLSFERPMIERVTNSDCAHNGNSVADVSINRELGFGNFKSEES